MVKMARRDVFMQKGRKRMIAAIIVVCLWLVSVVILTCMRLDIGKLYDYLMERSPSLQALDTTNWLAADFIALLAIFVILTILPIAFLGRAICHAFK